MRLPRIAFVVRSTLETIRGGDTIQALATARELRKKGVKVDIVKAGDRVDYRRYDLLHLFNLTRPADHLDHITNSGLPYVISTIFIDYSGFDTRGRTIPMRYFFRLSGKYQSEYLKSCYRAARHQDLIASRHYFKGHRRAMFKILSGARMLLPNSLSEFVRIKKEFSITNEFRMIPNGVDPLVFNSKFRHINRIDQVLCVGQIYRLKNQHLLIEATRKLGVRLVIIGKSPPNHQAYLNHCKQIARNHVEFHGYMPQEELTAHYARSKVHALPSWFETTGLSSLEAAAMGCNLVVGTGGDTHEYFDNHATFYNPQGNLNLERALETELNKAGDDNFRDHVLTHYTWEKAAEKTLSAYQLVLDG
jgi:glycosyltransferase involved in cell wall biosynthesis